MNLNAIFHGTAQHFSCLFLVMIAKVIFNSPKFVLEFALAACNAYIK